MESFTTKQSKQKTRRAEFAKLKSTKVIQKIKFDKNVKKLKERKIKKKQYLPSAWF